MRQFLAFGLGLVSILSTALGQFGLPQRLPAPPSSAGYGNAVAISGDTAVVAAANSTVGTRANAGKVYVFRWNGSAWAQEAEVTAPSPAADDQFGYAVALQNNTLFVSAPNRNTGPYTDLGLVFVFERSGTTWANIDIFGHNDPTSNDSFGSSLAVSGETVIVGCPAKTSDTGAAYVFTRSGNSWSQQQKLTASDAATGDRFGFSVAIDGEYAIAGALDDNASAGGAYVFVRTESTWAQQAKLTHQSPSAGDLFGGDVAIRGSLAVVGSVSDDVGAVTNQGSVTVFSRSNSTWTRTQQLVASKAAAGDAFGACVSISANTIAVTCAEQAAPDGGAGAGTVYLFAESDGVWAEKAVLNDDRGLANERFGYDIALSNDLLFASVAGESARPAAALVFSQVNDQWLTFPSSGVASDGAADDNFGYAVAMDGDYAIIGSYLDDSPNSNSGSIYLVKREGGLIVEQVKKPSGQANSQFGRAVDIDGDYVVAGAPLSDVEIPPAPIKVDAGLVAVYGRDGSTWTGVAELAASDLSASDFFGQSVGIKDRTVIVGAHGDDTGAISNHGSLYVFENFNTQVAKLTAPDKATGDLFGFSCGIDTDTIVVGAYAKDGSKGAAYIFIRYNGAWTYKGKLLASDGAAGDQFGYSVAIQKDTILVGAPNKGAGAVYVYGRNAAGAWPQVAKIVSPDASTGDRFGQSVDLSGYTIVVSASADDLPGKANSGACYLFTSTTLLPTGPWLFDRKLISLSPGAGDLLGFDCAISGNAVIAGSPKNSGAKGLITFFDFCDAEQLSVRNMTTSTVYPSLAAAITGASNTQSILAAAGSFDSASIDFGGKALTISSRSSISLNRTGLLLLNSNARLDAAPGSGIDIYCPVVTPADSGRAILSGEHVRFAGASSVLVEPGTLLLNTPSAEFLGTTNLRAGTSLINSTGDLTFEGTLNAVNGGQFTAARDINIGAMGNLRAPFFSAGGTVRLRATTTMLATNISAAALEITPGGGFTGGGMILSRVHNSGKMLITNASSIYGSLTSVTGSTINLAGSTFQVFGPTTLTGATVTGAITGCPNCLTQPASFTVEQSLSLDSSTTIDFAGTIEIGGSFVSEIANPANFRMRAGTIRLNAATGPSYLGARTFEAMSHDYGPAGAATREFVPGAFPLATLELGPSPTTVTIINASNNSSEALAEAVYLDSLTIPAGSRLNCGNTKIYVRSAQIDGVIDHPANIIALPGPCDADLKIDSVIDDADFELFLAAYSVFDCTYPAMSSASGSLPGGCPADLNTDGFVDDSDFSVFITAYDAFLCP